MKKIIALCILMLLMVGTGVFAQDDNELIVLTHNSFNVTESVLQDFEAETGISVVLLQLGDTGTMVNQLVLSRNNPLGDVVFGVDNTFLNRVLDNDVFVAYESELLVNVPEDLILDEEHRVTPVDYGDVCLNYDVAYFEENDLAVPDSLEALLEEDYRGLLVVQNPAVSSPGLAFLLVTIEVFGTEGDYTYLDYWQGLVDNDVLVTEDWSNAYYGEFTAGGGDGTRPLVVSYASSPPFTVDPETGVAASASVVADGTCFRQVEFAGIVAGTEKEALAQQFIDFLLDKPFQDDLSSTMYVFPVSTEAELPEDFANFAQIPDAPVYFDAASLDENREEWILAWTEIVLR